jgi:hypothetical protein
MSIPGIPDPLLEDSALSSELASAPVRSLIHHGNQIQNTRF